MDAKPPNLASEHRYGPSRLRTIYGGFVAGIACYFLTNLAVGNDDGLVLNGIISLDQVGATVFYWVLAGGTGLFALYFLLYAFQNVTNPKILRVDQDGITLPKGFLLANSVRIPYSAIESVSEEKVSHHTFLTIATKDGPHVLKGNWLPKSEYQSIKNLLTEQTRR